VKIDRTFDGHSTLICFFVGTIKCEPNSKEAKPTFHHLREAYDDAFRVLSTAVHEHAGLEDAEREYRERRDSLAQLIVSADPQEWRFAVERLAYSLWQRAGYPTGTAESNWYLAEALLAKSLPDTAAPLEKSTARE